jgi:hypothetical protein
LPDYRIYTLKDGGHIGQPADIVTVENDQEAIAHATKLINGNDLEIWDGPRPVARISATRGLRLRKS